MVPGGLQFSSEKPLFICCKQSVCANNLKHSHLLAVERWDFCLCKSLNYRDVESRWQSLSTISQVARAIVTEWLVTVRPTPDLLRRLQPSRLPPFDGMARSLRQLDRNVKKVSRWHFGASFIFSVTRCASNEPAPGFEPGTY
jgi:hypothetical protein